MLLASAGQDTGSGHIGSTACRSCHASRFESQSNTAHAHALRRARSTDPGPGGHAQWAFGAGRKAITWVNQTGRDSIAEHGLSYYAATKSLAFTPGHASSADKVYRTFDPVGTALRCFRCHSTGPITLTTNFQVQPSEVGVHCEACHGPGRGHANSGGVGKIQNPGRMTAVQINTLCGSCHRQASDLDDAMDWSNAWNVRHEPAYLHRAACFRNSNGTLSCLTCHDPHQPMSTAASFYDSRCMSCHANPPHQVPITSRSCISCHMPRVAISANLTFTNHWIGVYDPRGRKLIPSMRVVKDLRPAPARNDSAEGIVVPADPATLAPIYEKAVAEREREQGPDSSQVARAESDLGLFLLQIGEAAKAEVALRRTFSIDERNSDAAIDADRESLGLALAAEGHREEAFDLFRRTTEGNDLPVAARSFAKLAEMDREHADLYYEKAAALQDRASGRDSPKVAVLLHELALELRARNRDQEAEPLLRRALAIEQKTAKADPQLTVGILNTLGNLLEGRHELDEAEKLERAALSLSEEKFGPESAQLSMTCTNLADVLWNKKNLREAGQLYRRAIASDASLYGPERPETAADIANLGMLMNDAGQRESGTALLKQALAIYEQTLGPDSDQARFVREHLTEASR